MKANENFELSEKMKCFLLTLIIGFLSAFVFEGKVFSQDAIPLDITKNEIVLKSAHLTYGRGALSSGADMVLDFSWDKNRILFLKANNDRALVNIGKGFGNFKTILTIGVFKNVPCTALMLKYNSKFINLLSWNGIGFGKDAKLTGPGVTPRFFFSYQEVNVAFGKNYAGYAFMYKTVDPVNHFVFYRRSIPINKQADFTFETTYNYRERIPMFIIGYKHIFATK